MLVCMPRDADAQIEAIPPRTFEAPARAITIAVSSDLLYDTNVAKGSDAAAVLRRVKKKDVKVAPMSAINLSLPSGAALFTARGSVGYEYYARNERLNRERIDLTGGMMLPLASCVIEPEAAYTRRQNDLLDLSIDPDEPIRSTVNVQTTGRVEATVHCGPAEGIRPGGFVSYGRTKNSAAMRRVQDVEMLGYGSELSFASPTVGIVAAFVRRGDFTYDQRRIAGAAGPAQFQVTAAGLRIDRRLGARLQLVGTVSYADVTLPSAFGRGRELDGLNWTLAATLRLGDRLLVAADSERVIESSPGFIANFVRKSSYGGSVTYAVSPLLHLSASMSHRERAFQIAPIQPYLAITGDKTDDATLRLDYVRQRVRFRLDAAYQRRDADRELYDYDAFLVSVGISYLFKP